MDVTQKRQDEDLLAELSIENLDFWKEQRCNFILI